MEIAKPSGYKPFSQGNYETYSPLETSVLAVLAIEGCSLKKNPDPYGIDLLVKLDSEVIGGIEIESHAKYWDYLFPFKTVHFLGRKLKYANNNSFYILTSKGCQSAIMVRFRLLQNFPLVHLDNESCDQENMYDVPLHACIQGWSKINKHLSSHFRGHVLMKRQSIVKCADCNFFCLEIDLPSHRHAMHEG